MNEVHGPDRLYGLRYGQSPRHVTHQTLSGLSAPVQRQFAVDAINSFVFPAEVFHIAKAQLKQAKAPAPVVVRGADPSVGNLLVLRIKLGLIAAAELTDEKTAHVTKLGPPLEKSGAADAQLRAHLRHCRPAPNVLGQP